MRSYNPLLVSRCRAPAMATLNVAPLNDYVAGAFYLLRGIKPRSLCWSLHAGTTRPCPVHPLFEMIYLVAGD